VFVVTIMYAHSKAGWRAHVEGQGTAVEAIKEAKRVFRLKHSRATISAISVKEIESEKDEPQGDFTLIASS